MTASATRTVDCGEVAVLFVGTPPIDLQQTYDDVYTDPVDIEVVTDGRAALQRLTATSESPTEYAQPDLVLLQCDFELPDGMTVLHAIKSSPQLATVPVVVLDSDTGDAETIYDTGGNAYVKTPHTAEEYADLIRSITEFWFEWAQYPSEYLSSDTS
mgnify:CR=1 FL=1